LSKYNESGNSYDYVDYAPYRRKDQNSSSYDKFMVLQEEILAALPEEKRPLIDSLQDEINTLLMDEGD
jgi:hypothetical protein